MSTQQTATVYITNATNGNASIQLFHQNSSNGMDSGMWSAAPGATVGPLTVHFETGLGSFGILDYWCCVLRVSNGSNPGTYVSNTGATGDPQWHKECQLESADAGQTLTFSVNTANFNINLKSGGCSDGMNWVGPGAPVTNVFVLMLENHSFDNMLAFSGISGITAATTANSNSYTDPNTGQTTQYNVVKGAPASMVTDPGHEFPDTLVQLRGVGASYPPYAPINNSGFVANYATVSDEDLKPPPPANRGDIMACFDTPTQLPMLHWLANNFVVCDHWYSSIPGPTWPNRFFVHGASSNGINYSPSPVQIGEWELPLDGFKYPKGSIYGLLQGKGVFPRLYADQADSFATHPEGQPLGGVPQVSALSGVSLTGGAGTLGINDVEELGGDLQKPYPYFYTFIEPNYGEVFADTYEGGSSQHPMDDPAGGEQLLQTVYKAISNSPLWATSVLIITYDEHGGFYDSVAPPEAKAPDDGSNKDEKFHFDFKQYGVRVPAIVVSPLVKGASVDDNQYDHTSILKTLEVMLGAAGRPVNPLTNRDANANDLTHLWSAAAKPEMEARRLEAKELKPPTIQVAARKRQLSPEAYAARMAEPLPAQGNEWGFLHILAKTEYEMTGRTEAGKAAILANVRSIKTRGEAHDYGQRVRTMRLAERKKHKTKAAGK
ncbi:MAG TPA: alkaline phosphatase family protein [Candidatus Angelobacter sp.]|nr:alkaline phosphatase family protein [Candidatus Angelobacter sp.]